MDINVVATPAIIGNMMSNVEPLAREVCERVCRRTGMPEAEIPAWVDSHWEAAAAEIEAGNYDDTGDLVPGSDWSKGLEAYRERMAKNAR